MKRWLVGVGVAASACAAEGRAPDVQMALHVPHGHAVKDPTVRGARFVPESIDLATATIEAAGSARGVVSGTRFRVQARGVVGTADARIDDGSVAVPMPPRLGGGFLFLLGDTVSRSDDWLSPVRPMFRWSGGVTEVFAGLDRVYLRTKLGSHVALDPATGALLDLGPWPADPIVGSYVALDGWRALALTDVRGPVVTSDAGRTWTKLDVPMQVQGIVPVGRDAEDGSWRPLGPEGTPEAFVLTDGPLPPPLPRSGTVVQGPPPSPLRCYLVDDTFGVSPLRSCDDVLLRSRPVPRIVEASALLAAVERGWPLEDGTAVFVTGDDLVRVSLADGSVVETATNAFDHDPGPCHAVSLARAKAPSAFGFVCGGPSGVTSLFAYDAGAGRVVAVRRFSTPRLVQASGNGAWLVHGPCGEAESSSSTAYCVGVPSAPHLATGGIDWREVRVEDAPGAVATVTSDGRLARVVPAGLVTFVGKGGDVAAVPLRMVDMGGAMQRFVKKAVWLNDLEERTPGVLSGWLAAKETVVGVEIEADGSLRAGTYIQELGSPFVAGRYGIGWSRSQQGYETVDGGVTWTHFAAPVPLAPSKVRACGPAGCALDGWLRIGWGERPSDATPFLRPQPPLRRETPALPLTCRATEPLPPHEPPSPAVEGRGDQWFAAPTVSRADRLLHADVFLGLEPGRPELLGRIYAWGPPSGDWSVLGRWVTEWRSPFGGRTATASTAVGPAPFQDAEMARLELFGGRSSFVPRTVAVSDDGQHALIVARPANRAPEVTVTAVDAGGAEAPVRRADGGAWSGVDAALRIGTSWFIATSDLTHLRIEVFRVDVGVARPLASIRRRLALPAHGVPVAPLTATPARLARGEVGGTLGVVFEGEPPSDHERPRRWVVPIEIESGRVDEPEPLGLGDLSDRSEIAVCEEHTALGWVIDTPWWTDNVTLDLGHGDTSTHLRRVYARLRLSADRACVERLAGEASNDVFDVQRASAAASAAAISPSGPRLPVAVSFNRSSSAGPVAFVCNRVRR